MGQEPESTTPISGVDEHLESLAAQLAAAQVDDAQWPRAQMELLRTHQVYRWIVPRAYGGGALAPRRQLDGLLLLARGCVTTAFILTQWMAACQRIAATDHAAPKDRWLPRLADGSAFATVGISHLTTSRQHEQQPVLRAAPTADGYVFDGYTPWVTGAAHADVLVVGAVTADKQPVLAALPTTHTGITVHEPAKLLALTGSSTGPVSFSSVTVARDEVLAEPGQEATWQRIKARSGGLQTSALALGLSAAALAWLAEQCTVRADLTEPAQALHAEWAQLRTCMLDLADGRSDTTADEVRRSANSLVLRATQAALAAAKGAGFVAGHPVGRWCREALFFLVWSCPQPVASATLRDLARRA